MARSVDKVDSVSCCHDSWCTAVANVCLPMVAGHTAAGLQVSHVVGMSIVAGGIDQSHVRDCRHIPAGRTLVWRPMRGLMAQPYLAPKMALTSMQVSWELPSTTSSTAPGPSSLLPFLQGQSPLERRQKVCLWVQMP